MSANGVARSHERQVVLDGLADQDSVEAVAVMGRKLGKMDERRLLRDLYVKQGWFIANYDVSRDGQRFLMIKASVETEQATQLTVLQNWAEELTHRVQ